eukprot:1160930-Pelagomonas_calceolata.AAC.1
MAVREFCRQNGQASFDNVKVRRRGSCCEMCVCVRVCPKEEVWDPPPSCFVEHLRVLLGPHLHLLVLRRTTEIFLPSPHPCLCRYQNPSSRMQ